jgi:hypothetical protein
MSIFRVTPTISEGAINNPDFRNDLVLNQHTTGINDPQENPDFITSIEIGETNFEQIPITLNQGWNMFSFTGTQPLPVRDFFRLIFLNHNTNTDDDFDTYVQDIIILVKDIPNANLYFPEFNHSQIDSNGGLIPGVGYQAKFNFNPTGEGINKKNGLPILPNGVSNPSFPDLASLEGFSNITDYINAHANVDFNNTYSDGVLFMDLSKSSFTGFGFSRLQKKDVRQALYKLFFPQGAPGHVLDSNGFPVSGIFLGNIIPNNVPNDKEVDAPFITKDTPIGIGTMTNKVEELFINDGFIISTGLSDSIIEGSNPPLLARNTTMTFLIDDAIASIVDIVKDNDAKQYFPEYRFNGIGSSTNNDGYFIPGQGYQIRFNGQGTNPTPFNLPPDDIPNINPLIDGGTE